MSAALTRDDDPLLSWEGRLERLNYRNGMMLDDQDFRDEQTFHRATLALLLRHALGMGTLAGLKVDVTPFDAAALDTLKLTVSPGVAVDRIGRLICLDASQGLGLARWISGQPQDALRATISGGDVTADVFISLGTSENQRTQVFADGPFDGPDAVAPARLESRPRLDLVLRKESAAQLPNTLPRQTWPTDEAARMQAILAEKVVDGAAFELGRLREHAPGQNPMALFLARVRIGVSGGTGPVAVTGTVTIDNESRPLVALPGKWAGAAEGS